jgi:hypothetical protein
MLSFLFVWNTSSDDIVLLEILIWFYFVVTKNVQREREEKLARFLKEFLLQYVRGDKEGFTNRAESEARRLSATCQSCNP